MSTYLQVHFYHTLPPTIALYLIARPLMGNFDKIKLISISAIAIILIVCNKYAVTGSIRYISIEECLNSIIQSIFTALWTNLCTRWTLNLIFLKKTSRFRFQLVRFGGIAVLTLVMYLGWICAIPEAKTFYLGSMVWWSSVPLIVLWYLCGPYVCKRYASTLISIIMPSVYFCCADLLTMRAGFRNINQVTSLGIYIIDVLPLEDAAFFILSNTLIVISSHAFDKSETIIDTYGTEPFPDGTNVSESKRHFTSIKMLLDGSVCNEQNFDPIIVSDIETCNNFLNERAKSFSFAIKFFPNDIRQDLTILYSFSCITDDMIDDGSSVETKYRRLRVIRKFLDQLFSNRRITSEYCWELIAPQPKIDWPYFERALSSGELSSFRSISRIAYYLPQEPFYELMEGYKWDIDGRCIQNEGDLLEYATRVASSIGTLMTFVYCHRSNEWPDRMGPKCRMLFENARKISAVLQIYNCSLDIITDSEALGRCYIPRKYVEDDDLKYLIKDRNPHQIPNAQLKQYAVQMLDIADKMANDSIGLVINLLPDQCRRACLTKIKTLMDIGKLIRRNSYYERRTKVSMIQKMCTLLKCMYFTSLVSLNERGKQKLFESFSISTSIEVN